jgi:aspartate-semialdehyde dehydrogenase
VAEKWLPRAVAAGAIAIDNSSRFRHEPEVSLIVPEVNGAELQSAGAKPRLIANPNCSTIILLVGIEPLRRRFGLRAIDVATYQAVSGAGIPAMEELRAQAAARLAGQDLATSVFPEPCAFNVFNHESALDPESGLNGEEQKIIAESRRILGDPGLQVTPTCVRVPVFRAHSQAISILLERSATLDEVREAYADARGVRVVDDRARGSFPTPLAATGQDDVLVGRFRRDPASPVDAEGRSRRWCLFVSGDQLRKGAALNAIQIADLLGWQTKHAATEKRSPLNARSPSSVLQKNGKPATRQAKNPSPVSG